MIDFLTILSLDKFHLLFIPLVSMFVRQMSIRKELIRFIEIIVDVRKILNIFSNKLIRKETKHICFCKK
jgi:hypothetical protein